jgi:hypothetical protein
MNRLSISLAALAVSAVVAPQASAFTTPFFDDFNGNPATVLNGAPIGWQIGPGPFGGIDVVKNGDYGIKCLGNTGACVDLSGTPGTGTLMKSDNINLIGGVTYQLSVYISGNQVTDPAYGGGTNEQVRFGFVDLPTYNNATGSFDSLGGLLGQLTTPLLGSLTPFTLFTLTFTPVANVTTNIYFFNLIDPTSSNVGPIIDNVSLTAVPLPASAWLLLSGILALFIMSRRRVNTHPQGA